MLLLWLGGLLWTGACAGPEDRLPPGTVLVVRTEAGRSLLRELATLRGAPLAVASETALIRLEGCREMVASCPPGEWCDLIAGLRCGDAPESAGVPTDEMGDADVFFARRLTRGYFTVRARRNAAGWNAVVNLAGIEESGPLTLLLPAAVAPGPPILSQDSTLVHLRVKPSAGLRPGRFVTAGGWADRLFNLRSDLFVSRALDGVWELAVYVPDEGQIIPPIAIALDSSRLEEARGAMERFVQELRDRWPVSRSEYPDADERGACLSNLNVMPDLAPCYVAVERGLILGWNAGSVQRAMARSLPVGSNDGRSFLRLDLERFPLADERLRMSTGSEAALPPIHYPWRRMDVVGAKTGRHRLELEVSLVGVENR